MAKPVTVIRLGAGKRTIETNVPKGPMAGFLSIDLNALDKKTYGGVMRALRSWAPQGKKQ